MTPITYTFILRFKEVTRNRCTFLSEMVPYDHSYERYCDTLGVVELSTWILQESLQGVISVVKKVNCWNT